MLRGLYCCVVRLHPPSFRRRFGEEMIYIFDQQHGAIPALGVTLDCISSLFRQWTLRPHIGIELPASARQSTTAGQIPSFESLDTFQPRVSAIVPGTLLSLLLFYMIVLAIPYSWTHVLNLRFPEIDNDFTQPLSRNYNQSSVRQQLDVIPAEPDDLPRKTALPDTSHPSAAFVRARTVTIGLARYVGTYISNNPPATISIQIEGDPLREHLSLSAAGPEPSSFALSPASSADFVVDGVENSYVDFSADTQGRIYCLSFVTNGKAIIAKRQ